MTLTSGAELSSRNHKATLLSFDEEDENHNALPSSSDDSVSSKEEVNSNHPSDKNDNASVDANASTVTSSLTTCGVGSQAVISKYQISNQDYQNLTIDQLKSKYQLSDKEALDLETNCNIDFDWHKMSIRDHLRTK